MKPSSSLSSIQELQQCFQQLEYCMLFDERRLRPRLHALRQRLKNNQPIDRSLLNIQQSMALSSQQLQQRRQHLPSISYPEHLPISDKRQHIAEAISKHQLLILAGETGSGKTTQLPKICFELGLGMRASIAHTQPRRIAARSVASRIAEELACELGGCIGYKIRFSDQSRADTCLKLMTDGLLLAEIQSDPYLYHYDTIIIDEAHERSLNIDFLLGYVKQLLPKRPDLKVIITSATINTESFSAFFDHAPIIEVSGRSYPVSIQYQPISDSSEDRDRDQIDAIIAAVQTCEQADPLGDILVFLASEREIHEAAAALQKQNLRNTEILPLFSRLSNKDQDRVFRPHRGRRIILSTNVAETSLTVPGIHFVIDTGLARISRYSSRSQVQRLPIERISQANAQQRAGRCGRIAAGLCIRLYSETDFKQRPEHSDPEILRTHLASVLLRMKALKLGELEHFPLMDPPKANAIRDGMHVLHELQALDDKQGLSAIGQLMAKIPIDPRMARMLWQAHKEHALHEVLIIVTALSIQDPRQRPKDQQSQADAKHQLFRDKDSDFITWLKLWNWYEQQAKQHSRSGLKKQCQQHFLAFMRMREWRELYQQLRRVLQDFGLHVKAEQYASNDAIHRSLLSGLLSHIAMRCEDKSFLGTRGLKLAIFPASSLFKKPPRWIMAAEWVETSRLYARGVAAIDPAWLEDLAPHLIKRQYTEAYWSRKRQQIMAHESLSLFGLQLLRRRVHYGPIQPAEARKLFIQHALVLGELRSHAAFLKHNQQLLDELEILEAKTRRRDLLAEEQQRYDFFDAIVAENIYHTKSFEAWRKNIEQKQPKCLFFDKELLLQQTDVQISKHDYPDHHLCQGHALAYQYHFDPSHHADGISLLLPQALLSSLDQTTLDWLVPGMLEEKLLYLIKSLPKQLRRNFVPAPRFAKAAREAMPFRQGELLQSFAKHLYSMTGVTIQPSDWDLSKLPKHLHINIRVHDEAQNIIAEDQDLAALQKQYATRKNRTQLRHRIEKDGLKSWNFGDLPDSIQVQEQQFELQRFPALVDRQDSVSIRLFDHQKDANEHMQKGLLRLYLLNMPQQVKSIEKQWQRPALLLYANRFGNSHDMRQACLEKVFEQVFSKGLRLRSQADFQQQLQQHAAQVIPTAERLFNAVETMFKEWVRLETAMQNSKSPAKQSCIADIKQQLARLWPKHQLNSIPAPWLYHIPRFLQAAHHRLEKAGRNSKMETMHGLHIQQLYQRYDDLLTHIDSQHPHHERLQAFRWHIEELAVSLFAPELKTSLRVSYKRLEKQAKELS